MKLIIGGYAQGKLNYVLKRLSSRSYQVWDGEIPEQPKQMKTDLDTLVIINHFSCWVRKCIEKGGCPEEEIICFLECYPDVVIISDEIGCGIVPMEAFEREYRERTGRLLTELAERAEEVERVICGIGQRIK
ncbi:MAG: hypothetical protein GX234_03565 [Clostridiales bacterium]|nr:hypothetical protein [Clostridiales bacterium]